MPNYIGQCDKIRRTGQGENLWQTLMENKKQISEQLFLEHAIVKDILDDSETWEEYKSGCSDDLKFFCSKTETMDVVFFQTCGFEFFWSCF
jgi:hypothetical protein